MRFLWIPQHMEMRERCTANPGEIQGARTCRKSENHPCFRLEGSRCQADFHPAGTQEWILRLSLSKDGILIERAFLGDSRQRMKCSPGHPSPISSAVLPFWKPAEHTDISLPAEEPPLSPIQQNPASDSAPQHTSLGAFCIGGCHPDSLLLRLGGDREPG